MKTNCTMHAEQPDGYLPWHHWAMMKNKTHRQIRCDECNLYQIWVERKKRVV